MGRYTIFKHVTPHIYHTRVDSDNFCSNSTNQEPYLCILSFNSCGYLSDLNFEIWFSLPCMRKTVSLIDTVECRYNAVQYNMILFTNNWRQTGDKPLSKPVFRLVYWRILMHHAASMSLLHGRSWAEPMCAIFLGNYLRKYKNTFIFSICHWDGAGSWNITLWKTNIQILHAQCHGRWWLGDARGQCIN